MDGQHTICLLESAWDANERRFRARDSATGQPLDATWAATALLAAYDHELFHPWRPGQEIAWKATLDTLAVAKGRVMAGLIPLRLREYRTWDGILPAA